MSKITAEKRKPYDVLYYARHKEEILEKARLKRAEKKLGSIYNPELHEIKLQEKELLKKVKELYIRKQEILNTINKQLSDPELNKRDTISKNETEDQRKDRYKLYQQIRKLPKEERKAILNSNKKKTIESNLIKKIKIPEETKNKYNETRRLKYQIAIENRHQNKLDRIAKEISDKAKKYFENFDWEFFHKCTEEEWDTKYKDKYPD